MSCNIKFHIPRGVPYPCSQAKALSVFTLRGAFGKYVARSFFSVTDKQIRALESEKYVARSFFSVTDKQIHSCLVSF